MAETIFDSFKGLIHDTASALIDKQVSKQASDAVTNLVSASFGMVDSTLKIVQQLTEPSPSPSPSPPPSPPPSV